MAKKKRSKKQNGVHAAAEPDHPNFFTPDSQPLTSPYSKRTSKLLIGSERTEFTVFTFLLDKYPKIQDQRNSLYFEERIDLFDVHGDVGHTLVHFLYTGDYQTLRVPDASEAEKKKIEYDRALMAHSVALTYDLPVLASHAQNQLDSLDLVLSFSSTLDSIKAAFTSRLCDNEWLRSRLNETLDTFFRQPEGDFNQDEVTSHIGSCPNFDKAVVDFLTRICRENTRPQTEQSEETKCEVLGASDGPSNEQSAEVEEFRWEAPPEEYERAAECEPPADGLVHQDEEAAPEPPPEVDYSENGYAEEVKPDEDYHYPPDEPLPPEPDQAEEASDAPPEDYGTVSEPAAPEQSPVYEYVPVPEETVEDIAYDRPAEEAPEPPSYDEPVPEEPTMESTPADPTDMGVPMEEAIVADPPDGWYSWGAASSKKKKGKKKGKGSSIEVQ